MRWRGRRQSSNIEDRRSGGGYSRSAPGGAPMGYRTRRVRTGGGLGIGAIIIIVIIAWVTGVNPLQLLGGGGGSAPVPSGSSQPAGGALDDDGARFVSVVLADTEDTWKRIFADGGVSYQDPTLVLFTDQTRSPCGFASAATGPFYCPADRKVYIDLGFYRELRTQFNAPGDFAQAYVIAHEIGHHVQNLLGVLPDVNAARRRASQADANQLSVRLELQADCLAGIWAHDAEGRGLLEVGDIDEALNAAAQIGDDAIQKRTQGYVVPESFNHGSSEQRSRWFTIGYQEGRLDACNTFGVERI